MKDGQDLEPFVHKILLPYLFGKRGIKNVHESRDTNGKLKITCLKETSEGTREIVIEEKGIKKIKERFLSQGRP